MYAVVLNNSGRAVKVADGSRVDYSELVVAGSDAISKVDKPYTLLLVNEQTGKLEDQYIGPDGMKYYTYKD